jgi:hypothetical protein
LQNTLSTKADPKPANITAPAITTLTKANLEAMNISLSAATRNNTTTAKLLVAGTKGHRRRKAGGEENKEPVPKKFRMLHKSAVESVVQNEGRRTEKTAPKKFGKLILRTTNPTEPRTSQNKRKLEENDMLLPNPKETRVFQEVRIG